MASAVLSGFVTIPLSVTKEWTLKSVSLESIEDSSEANSNNHDDVLIDRVSLRVEFNPLIAHTKVVNLRSKDATTTFANQWGSAHDCLTKLQEKLEQAIKDMNADTMKAANEADCTACSILGKTRTTFVRAKSGNEVETMSYHPEMMPAKRPEFNAAPTIITMPESSTQQSSKALTKRSSIRRGSSWTRPKSPSRSPF